MDDFKKFDFIFAEIHGKNLIIEFLNKLDKIERAQIISNIYKFIELLNINPFPNPKISKYLKDGIFELKINLPNKTSRILYFFMSDKLVVLTNAFIKKTEKTPIDEINKALKIKEFYKGKK